MTDTLLAAIVLLGACVQWLTGMGFALVCVPALVLLLGPADGVVLANCAAAACTVPAGAWLTRHLPHPVLLLVMGGLVTAAVLLVMRGARVPALRGGRGAVTAGALGGFMNAAAGVGGPPVSLYALNAGWTVREFVPNAQFYGVVVNAFSLAANGLPRLAPPQWALAASAMTAGALAGHAVAARIPEHRARHLVLVLALAGGATAMTKGLWGLWPG